MKTNQTRSLLRAASAALALSFAAQATAASYQWDVNDSTAGLGGTGTWDTTSAFWDLIGADLDDGTDITTAYTFTNADTAIFGGTAGTVTLGTPITVNSLVFQTTGYTVTADTLTLDGTTPTITTNTGVDATISSILAGSAGLTKAGAGTLTFSGANTYSGVTNLNSGTLKFGIANAITSSGILANVGATTLDLAGFDQSILGLRSDTLTTPVVTNSAAGTGTNTLTITGGWWGAYSGTIQDGATAKTAVSITGLNGRISHLGVNTYTGGLTITGNGTAGADAGAILAINSDASLGAVSNVVTLNNNGTLFNGTSNTSGWLASTTPTLAAGRSIVLGSTIGGGIRVWGGTTMTVNSTISGTGKLTKTDTGTLVLGGNNTYTGGTQIDTGTLIMTGTSNLGAGLIFINGSGRTLNIATGATVTSTGQVNIGNSSGGSLLVNGTLNVASFAASWNPTAVTVNGTMNVTGNWAFSTNANSPISGTGTISVGGDFNLSNASTGVNFGSGGTTLTIAGKLSMGSTNTFTQTAGTVNFTTAVADNIRIGESSNADTYAINGGTYNAMNTATTIAYNNTGTFTVAGGTANAVGIKFGQAASTAAGTLNLNSGTLNVGGSGITDGSTGANTINLNFAGGTLGALAAWNSSLAAALTNTTTVNTTGGNIGLSGVLSSTGGLNKIGSNTLTLSGANTYTGATTVTAGTLALTGSPTGNSAVNVNGGTLKLDYGTNDTSKIHDSAVLTLGGGTLELAGGTHTEVAVSTTLAAGKSTVSQTSGTAVLAMNTITPTAGASVNFTAANIATTDNLNNAEGILGSWATIGGDWAVNSTNGPDGLITAYSSYTDVTRLDSGTKTIADATASNVRIIEGTGTLGDITMAVGGTTNINTLNQTATGGTTTVAIGTGNTLRLGADGGVLAAAGVGRLDLIGGTLTAGGGAVDVAGSINFSGDTSNTISVSSVIANNGTGAVSLVKTGTGTLVLNAANTFSGGTTIQQGTVAISAMGNPGAPGGSLTGFGTGVVTVNTGGTAWIHGSGSSFGTIANNWTLAGGTLHIQDGATTFSGTVAVNAASTIQEYWGDTITLSGAMSGTGNLSFANAGSAEKPVFILSGSNASYTGNINVGANLTVRLGSGNGFGPTTTGVTKINVASGGTVNFDGKAGLYGYTIAGTGATGAGALINNGTTISNGNAQTSNLKLSANASVGGTGDWALLASAYAATSLDLGGYTLTKVGANMVSLVTATTTAGTMQVSGGILQFGSSNGGTGVVGAASSLILDNTAGVGLNVIRDSSIGALAGGGTTGGGVNLNPGTARTLTVGALGSNTTYAGVISGASGGFVKLGTGTLTLTGVNTYTGQTAIQGGTLLLSGAGSLNSGSYAPNINFSNNGILELASSATQTLSGNINGAGSILKTSGGDLTLSGPSTYTGGTNITTGRVTLNHSTGAGTGVISLNGGGAELQLGGGVTVANALLVADSAGAAKSLRHFNATASTYAGAITISEATANDFTVNVGTGGGLTVSGVVSGLGAAGITKQGTGTLTLSGNNTYTGATTVNNGRVNFSGSNVSSITLASGATLGGTGSTTGGLTANAGATIALNGVAPTSAFSAAGAVDIAGSTAIIFDAPPPLGTTTHYVFNYGSLTGFANLTAPVGYRMSLTDNTVAKRVELTTTTGVRTWNVGTTSWDVLTSTSWQEDDFMFANGDSVVFDDTAVDGVVAISGAVLPSSITVDNSGLAFAFSGAGAIGGATGLTKSGTSTLTIANANTFTGGVAITGGTLSVAAANNLGTGTGNIAISNNAILATTATHTLGRRISADTGGATVDVASGTTLTHTNGFLGGNTLTKTGLGTLAFSGYGGSTFASGALVINAGTVRFNTGAFNTNLGLASITVNNGGTLLSPSGVAHSLGGYGAATPALTINTGGTYQADQEQYLNSVTLAGGQITGAFEVRTDNSWAFNVTENSSMSVRINGVQTDVAINVATGKTFTMSGKITNSKPLVKNGDGTMVLTNSTNDYTGATTINAGSLALGNGGATGTLPTGSAITNNGNFAINRSNAVAQGTDFSGAAITGTGSFTQAGSGTTTLTAANTYTGATTVNAGTLAINGDQTAATGAVTVNNVGSTLAGTGAVGGATTLAAGTNLAPAGAVVGTLAFKENVTLNVGGNYAVDVTSATTSDKVTLVAGKTFAANGTITLTPTGHTFAAGDTYDVVDGGTITGTPTISPATPGAGLEWDTTDFAANGVIKVVSGSPYDDWAGPTGFNLTQGKFGDDDNDGVPNLLEFATNADPTNPASGAKVFPWLYTDGGNTYLTYTVAVRDAAVFAVADTTKQQADKDRVRYTVEATSDLSTWNAVVTELDGPTSLLVQAAILPALPALDTGWSYHSFRTDDTTATDTEDFIRLKVEETP